MNDKFNGILNGHENVKVEIYLPDNMNNRLKGSLNGHADTPLPPSADGTATGGKDAATGRFLPGNKCGRGNPHYRRLAANRAAFLEAVGPEQVKGLAAELFKRAMAGDMDAARLVLAYGVGRPQPAADPDGADAEEWRIRLAWPDFSDVLAGASKITFTEAIDAIRRIQKEEEPVPISLDGVVAGESGEALPRRTAEPEVSKEGCVLPASLHESSRLIC